MAVKNRTKEKDNPLLYRYSKNGSGFYTHFTNKIVDYSENTYIHDKSGIGVILVFNNYPS